MPRHARQKSTTGIYHIMVRGNERKAIFKMDEDKERYMDTLLDKKRNGEYTLYGYCIMDNHVHLVIKEEAEPIERAMKRIGVSYAQYYNHKHERVGHVFQDRYKSEEIENDTYLLSALRYIHKNPEKAKICHQENYKWSSYSMYVEGERSQLVDASVVLDIFSESRRDACRLFKDFSSKEEGISFLDIEEDDFELNEAIKEYVKSYLSDNKLINKDLQKPQNRGIRDVLVADLKSKFNLSSRKISEATGINRETARIALSKRTVPADKGN